MRAKTTQVLATVALVAACNVARADANALVVVQSNDPVVARSVSGYGAPDALAGVLATAYFHDGSTEQALFTVAGTGLASSALAAGSLFNINVFAGGSDSQPGRWRISNTHRFSSLMAFELDGRGLGAGSVGFDGSPLISAGSTPGSGAGAELLMDFTDVPYITGWVTTTYSVPVALGSADPVGDLFAKVRVDFEYDPPVSLDGGLPAFSAVSSQNFHADIDQVVYAPVPEPASWATLLAGAGLLLGLRRRQ
jgi:hypothetical protein